MPFEAAPAADFSQDTWWIWVIKGIAIVLYLILSVLFALWVERRALGRMQTRKGPNYLGPWGHFQAIADALKLVLKEDFWLGGTDKLVYLIAPAIAAFSAFMIYAVIPFGPNVDMFGINTPLQLTDMPVGVLYILAITGLGIYGLVLGGWSSNSPFPLLGSIRTTAQVISYELSMSISLLSVFLVAGSMSTSQIVATQAPLWWVVLLLPSFVFYWLSAMAETNRVPFDLPEAEGEIVAGAMTEYSSMKFAWFYLAEYIAMINVSGITTTIFFGGWRAPWPITWFGDAIGWDPNTGWWPILWFLVKVWFFMFCLVWIRGTLLRVRYDQLMKFGWKVLIPGSLAWLVMVALVQGVRQFTGMDLRTMLIAIAAVFAVIMVVLLVIPERKPPEDEVEPEFDAFAGGYPVPPLPGVQLPPSPRRRRRDAAMAMTTKEDRDE